MTSRHSLFLLLLSTMLIACACAAAPQISQQFVARLLVMTVAEWPSTTNFTNELAKHTDAHIVAVRAISTHLFAVHLGCADAVICQHAVERLQAANTFIKAVEPDGRVTLPTLPERKAAE